MASVLDTLKEKVKDNFSENEENRDRIKEGKEERQSKIEKQSGEDFSTTEETPTAPNAEKRNEAPGSMGGHV